MLFGPFYELLADRNVPPPNAHNGIPSERETSEKGARRHPEAVPGKTPGPPRYRGVSFSRWSSNVSSSSRLAVPVFA